MTITTVGSFVSSGFAPGRTTVAVNPTAIGDCLVVFTIVQSGSISVASMSGGGVSSWTRIAGPFQLTFNCMDIWLGKITATGSSTITITGTSSLAAENNTITVQQFTSGGGAATVWAPDGVGGGLANGSSTAVTYATLTPGGAGRAYVGFAYTDQNGLTSGQTAGYTVVLDPVDANTFIYNTDVSTGQSPVSAQTPAGGSTAIAALISAAPAVVVPLPPIVNRTRLIRASCW